MQAEWRAGESFALAFVECEMLDRSLLLNDGKTVSTVYLLCFMEGGDGKGRNPECIFPWILCKLARLAYNR
jgi:hypothetical protein